MRRAVREGGLRVVVARVSNPVFPTRGIPWRAPRLPTKLSHAESRERRENEPEADARGDLSRVRRARGGPHRGTAAAGGGGGRGAAGGAGGRAEPPGPLGAPR